MARTILFVEVPCFYAVVERADDPAAAGRPVLVGGDPRKGGRVQSATPDALARGVRLEMPMLEALRHCPQARVVRTQMPRYREVSRRLLAGFRRVLPRLEPFGLAAAYAELPPQADAAAIADELQRSGREGLGLPVRVGVARSKFLARLAAEERPEGGFRRIAPGEEAAFLDPLPVSRLDGVGRKTEATLAALGARTIADVRALGRERLEEVFGTHGLRIHACATASDDEPVRAVQHPQSVSREATVRGEPRDLGVLDEQLAGIAQQLEVELARLGLSAGKVTLKLRFEDEGSASRTLTLQEPVASAVDLRAVAQELLARTPAGARPVRGLGLQLARLGPADAGDRQLRLFSDL
jgi:DNA polymerase-4